MGAGRPSKFQPAFIRIAESMCKLAATDVEIADALNVNIATLYRWKATNPEFCDALKSGKAELDERVERSLFARATGYEHDEIDIKVVDGKIVKTKVRKFYPPETVAAIFWLKNRRSADWRDQKTLDVTHHKSELTDAELEAIATGSGNEAPAQAPGSQFSH